MWWRQVQKTFCRETKRVSRHWCYFCRDINIIITSSRVAMLYLPCTKSEAPGRYSNVRRGRFGLIWLDLPLRGYVFNPPGTLKVHKQACKQCNCLHMCIGKSMYITTMLIGSFTEFLSIVSVLSNSLCTQNKAAHASLFSSSLGWGGQTAWLWDMWRLVEGDCLFLSPCRMDTQTANKPSPW